MLRRILLAIDASEQSTKAVALAAAVAKSFDSGVDVLHVHEVGMVASVGTRRDADRLVSTAAEELREAGVRASGQAVTALSGQAATTIVEAARLLGSDLIVMGTRGLCDLAGVLIGSMAHKVIHRAECPVMVVR